MDVDDVLVFKAADDVRDGLALPDVSEELVAEALTLARALHEPGDVHEVHRRRHDAFAVHRLRQRREAAVRHHRDTQVRVYGGERVVLGFGPGPC